MLPPPHAQRSEIDARASRRYIRIGKEGVAAASAAVDWEEEPASRRTGARKVSGDARGASLGGNRWILSEVSTNQGLAGRQFYRFRLPLVRITLELTCPMRGPSSGLPQPPHEALSIELVFKLPRWPGPGIWAAFALGLPSPRALSAHRSRQGAVPGKP